MLKIEKIASESIVGLWINKRHTKNMQNKVQHDDCNVCGIIVGIKSRNLASSS